VRTLRDLLLHGRDDRRIRMAEDERAVPAEVVDILVAVDIPLERTGRSRRINGIGEQRAGIVGQPGRNDLARLLIKLGGAARARVLSGSMSKPVTAWPFSMSRRVKPSPISPSPTNPTAVMRFPVLPTVLSYPQSRRKSKRELRPCCEIRLNRETAVSRAYLSVRPHV
jgi:hypothetical protein